MTHLLLFNLWMLFCGGAQGFTYAIILSKFFPRLTGPIGTGSMCFGACWALAYYFSLCEPQAGTFADIATQLWPATVIAAALGFFFPVTPRSVPQDPTQQSKTDSNDESK